MKWEKKDNYWVAKGNDGKFIIRKKSIFYYASYTSQTTTFNLPRNTSIKAVKQMCQDNFYWEE